MNQQYSLNRRIFALALPAIASNITVPLLGLCDTAVAGHLGNETFLAAIAAGGMMLNVVYWVFGFLRMGTTGLTAEAHGAQNKEMIGKVFSRAVSLAIISGLVILLFKSPLRLLLTDIIDMEEGSAVLASEYFNICIWGAPALLVTLSINGWFVGMQNTVWPMVVSISVNIINVACSLSAVFLLHLGFKGVAYGTLTANWAGLVIALCALARFSRGMRLWSGMRNLLKGGNLGKFFSVSNNLMLRSCCIMIVTLAVTSYGARLGDLTLAVNAVVMQYFVLYSYFMDGMAFSGEALCGNRAGAADRHGVVRVVKAICWWGAGISIVFALLYLTVQSGFTSLLTDVNAVRVGVGDLRMVVVLIPIVSGMAFLFDGFYIGLTATWRMLVTTFVASALFFVIILIGAHDNATLWCAFLAYLLLRGVGLAVQFPSLTKKIPDRRVDPEL
ncbi:MAG: MATE family efflux transporter [Muribaculaceae bacterium]|nr:MATE family efflux transporter [Muribaculaceae bacterium]